MKTLQKLIAVAGAITLVPVAVNAAGSQNTVTINRGLSLDANAWSFDSCSQTTISATVSESGYKATGNISVDQYQNYTAYVFVYYMNYCNNTEFALNGYSAQLPITIRAQGGQSYGQQVAAKGTADIPATGYKWDGSVYQTFNETVHLVIDGTGVITNLTNSDYRNEYPLGAGTYSYTYKTDGVSGPATLAQFTISSPTLGVITPSNPGGTVYRSNSSSHTVIFNRPAATP